MQYVINNIKIIKLPETNTNDEQIWPISFSEEQKSLQIKLSIYKRYCIERVI